VAFDDELRRAFRREAPPDGFTERTMAAIDLRSSRLTRRRLPRRAAWLALAAAMLLLAIGAGMVHTRQQAARARREVEIGLRVASEKLDQVQRKVIEATQRRGAENVL
jgi:hypothetical protein